MDRYTHLTGSHTSDVGRIKTLQSHDSTKFYIELEFFSPLRVAELAELCREGDIHNYAVGLINRLRPEGA